MAREGVERVPELWRELTPGTLVIQAADVPVREHGGRTVVVDFKKAGVGRKDRAVASLGILAGLSGIFRVEDLIETAMSILPPSQRDATAAILRTGADLSVG